MKKIAFLTAVGIFALSLTGCSGVEKDATYDDATALREAVIKSDVECPGEKQENTKSGSSIKCTQNLMLEIVNDESLRKLAPIAMQFTGKKHSILTGPNWIIQSDTSTLSKLQEKLGGELEVL